MRYEWVQDVAIGRQVGQILFNLSFAHLSFAHFHSRLGWMLAAPFVATLVGDAIYAHSWRLATQRGFKYLYNTCEASWDDNGERIVSRYTPNTSS